MLPNTCTVLAAALRLLTLLLASPSKHSELCEAKPSSEARLLPKEAASRRLARTNVSAITREAGYCAALRSNASSRSEEARVRSTRSSMRSIGPERSEGCRRHSLRRRRRIPKELASEARQLPKEALFEEEASFARRFPKETLFLRGKAPLFSESFAFAAEACFRSLLEVLTRMSEASSPSGCPSSKKMPQ